MARSVSPMKMSESGPANRDARSRSSTSRSQVFHYAKCYNSLSRDLLGRFLKEWEEECGTAKEEATPWANGESPYCLTTFKNLCKSNTLLWDNESNSTTGK
ncbi:hypothetical protein BEWA_028240 [Theileria equi strain WA]|uniref:Uncharacterized protein n=1 Tax=Theileria equi strain WA TaxID=1537102 RepID=L0AWQ5_THEEQ|nr:hypothetical protein BEWA_028240 [Theileria equi strain WA]AFZ79975.1 hypothetical protein BEWA_028240 [Theileria equi strain WA]|eukprot:XP_004829641.1 hypothetical protein BEWA_028240 [Theileria equi strain WA]